MNDRTRLLELKAAIADRSVFEAAGKCRLLRYNRTTTAAAGYDIPSAVRDELHRHITQKINLRGRYSDNRIYDRKNDCIALARFRDLADSSNALSDETGKLFAWGKTEIHQQIRSHDERANKIGPGESTDNDVALRDRQTAICSHIECDNVDGD